MSKELNMSKLMITRASRVIVREHITNALIALSQLEKSTDKFSPCLHRNAHKINASIKGLRQLLEEDLEHTDKVISEIDTYKISNDCNDMKLLRKEIDKL